VNRKVALAGYQDFSARTSENVRQLSFAALGVIWVFKPAAGFAFSKLLLWAGTLGTSALAADFLQSLYGTLAWGTFHRTKERAGLSQEQEFRAPRKINWPTNTFFGLKIVALGAAYALLFVHR
jgi:hypothetical protein